MTRLDELISLRTQIEVEIERERINSARAKKLRRTALVAITRGSWNTRVFSAVCEHFNVSGDDILGDARTSYVTDARHVAMWLMKEANRSYPEVGRELGRDHTTVMYGVKRVNNHPELLATAAEIRSLLTGEDAA